MTKTQEHDKNNTKNRNAQHCVEVQYFFYP